MQVKIENAKLKQSIELLFNLSLKGKQSRHRSKFINLMKERFKEVEEQRLELLKEHAEKDDEGEPIKEENTYKLIDQKAFMKDFQELMEEELIVEGGDNQKTLETVKEVLEECDVAFSGNEAMIYDYLCDQFEEGE